MQIVKTVVAAAAIYYVAEKVVPRVKREVALERNTRKLVKHFDLRSETQATA